MIRVQAGLSGLGSIWGWSLGFRAPWETKETYVIPLRTMINAYREIIIPAPARVPSKPRQPCPLGNIGAAAAPSCLGEERGGCMGPAVDRPTDILAELQSHCRARGMIIHPRPVAGHGLDRGTAPGECEAKAMFRVLYCLGFRI